MAPSAQNSAVSHSITLRHSIEVHPHDFSVENVKAYSCSGTPGDCVRVGSLCIMDNKPDVVLSGINFGVNVASDIQYSATAGAAFEAEFQGCHAIAVSEAATDRHEVTDKFLFQILEELIYEPYVEGEIWNVNFPGCSLDECRGILRDRKVSRKAYFKDHYNLLKRFPDGGMELMVEGIHTPAEEKDTDYAAVLGNFISIGKVKNIR